jgi:hypothetical protein
MILKHFINDLLVYFFPASIALTITIIAIERLRTKKIVLWTNISLFIFVMFCSLFTIPPKKNLIAEFAFFSFTNDFAHIYDLNSDSQKKPPEFLSVKQVPDHLDTKKFPVVHSGESARMKLKLNQKAYVYILHADIAFQQSKFPVSI